MAIIFTYPLVKPGKLYKEDRFVLSKMDEAGNPTKQTTLNEITKYVSKYGQFEASPYTINGLINNLASAGSGGYDFMEWVSNVTSTTQIPVMKLPHDVQLVSVSYVWMGDTALSIGVGEQVAFSIGTIPNGVNPIIANYTSIASLFDLTNADDGTYANNVIDIGQDFNKGDIIAVVGQETGTVTPNNGELGISLLFKSI